MAEPPGTWSALGTVRLAVMLVWRSGRGLLLAILASAIVTSLAIAGQLLMGRELLDLVAGSDEQRARDLWKPLAALGTLMMISSMSQTIGGELRMPLGERVHRTAMNEILDVATEVPVEAYESTDFHDRLERAQAAAGTHSSAVVFGFVTIMTTALIATGVVLVLVSVIPAVVPIAVLGYLPVAYVSVRNNRARHRMESALTELGRERNYLEYLMTHRVEAKELRSYAIAPRLRLWHDRIWDERLTELVKLVRRRVVLSTAGTFVTTTILVGTLSFVLVLAGRDAITIGDAAVAIVGLQQLSNRMQAAGTAFTGVHHGVTFLRDFELFRGTVYDPVQFRPTGTPPTPPHVLTVENLRYRYPGSDVDAVASVSFEVRRGQSLAIVGANGSGKSTLASLMCQLLRPAEGTIRWDGVDLSGCDPDRVRAQIAPVFQDFASYTFTIRQVIGLGDVARTSDERRIREVLAEVDLDDLVQVTPHGLDTRLGKMFTDGIDLSVGQWQRLAIARALFRDAPILILDEPSASLDPRAEAALFDLLHRICDDRIVVFVSHRFATVRSADQVMVLDAGAVVELGSHDELMAVHGLYHELFNMQADRYGLASGG